MDTKIPFMKNRFLLILLFPLLLMSCKTESGPEMVAGDQIFGLASPIRLNRGSTEVDLRDYFLDVSNIDSVTAESPSAPLVKISEDRTQLTLTEPGGEAIDPLSVVDVWSGGINYSLLCRRTQKESVRLSFDPEGKTYASVAVAGSLNNWDPKNSPMQQNEEGIWQVTLDLDPGAYQYQVVVDGEWMLDPGNPVKVDNNIGGFNSQLIVEGPEASKLPSIRTASAEGGTLRITAEGEGVNLIGLWENHVLEAKPVEGEANTWEIQIPKAGDKKDRSFVRVYSFNLYGPGNDLLIPVQEGIAVTSPNQLTRYDREAMIMYFMLVDRFNNGDKSNDAPLDDERVDPKANYQGGDLQGVAAKINEGFFEDLGVNTLWISPINQNPQEAFQEWPEPRRWFSGYHGYWPVSSSQVDTRFGGNAAFKQLVDDAHAKDYNILLDVVANHVHEQHPMIQANPDWKTQLDLPDGRKNIRIWEEQRLTTWFDTFMPSLDFSKQEVIDAQVDSTFYWVNEFGIDGYRHDATKHIPETFWRALTSKLKNDYMVPNHQNLYQIGETFGSRELIGSYIGSGMVDGQFDFNLYFDARSTFADDAVSFEKLNSSLQESFNWYGYHHKMGNITGNHDIPRFISFAGEAMVFNEDDKEAGWTRDIQVKNPVGYQKLSMLTAFIMTIPGVPIIYYGDEYGVAGAGDPDNRRFMEFDGYSEEEIATKERCKKLIELRKNHLALLYGDFNVKSLGENHYVYSRSHFDDYVVVAFNKSSETQTVNFDLDINPGEKAMTAHFNGKADKIGGAVTMELPAYSFEVLTWE